MLLAPLAACGTPAGLDADEAATSARTCASLLERAAVRRAAAEGSARMLIAREKVDLFIDPGGFYRALVTLRNAERFARAASGDSADRRVSAAAIVTQCRPGR